MAKARTRARRGHWASLKDLVALWVDLFKRHNLLTYASAIAFQTFVAVVALLSDDLGDVGRRARLHGRVRSDLRGRGNPPLVDPVSDLDRDYLRTFANYKTAAGSLLGIYFVTTFLYVAAIILMVGVELDEQLREDVAKGEERGILELVRDVL